MVNSNELSHIDSQNSARRWSYKMARISRDKNRELLANRYREALNLETDRFNNEQKFININHYQQVDILGQQMFHDRLAIARDVQVRQTFNLKPTWNDKDESVYENQDSNRYKEIEELQSQTMEQVSKLESERVTILKKSRAHHRVKVQQIIDMHLESLAQLDDQSFESNPIFQMQRDTFMLPIPSSAPVWDNDANLIEGFAHDKSTDNTLTFSNIASKPESAIPPQFTFTYSNSETNKDTRDLVSYDKEAARISTTKLSAKEFADKKCNIFLRPFKESLKKTEFKNPNLVPEGNESAAEKIPDDDDSFRGHLIPPSSITPNPKEVRPKVYACTLNGRRIPRLFPACKKSEVPGCATEDANSDHETMTNPNTPIIMTPASSVDDDDDTTSTDQDTQTDTYFVPAEVFLPSEREFPDVLDALYWTAPAYYPFQDWEAW